MTRYQLRFAGQFKEGVLDRVAIGISQGGFAEWVKSIALLAPENDGDLNTERIAVETYDVTDPELVAVKRLLKSMPDLKSRRVTSDTYAILGQVLLGKPGWR